MSSQVTPLPLQDAALPVLGTQEPTPTSEGKSAETTRPVDEDVSDAQIVSHSLLVLSVAVSAAIMPFPAF